MNLINLDELSDDLKRLKNPPKKLNYLGNKNLLSMNKVAIVGSRKASAYTKNMVQNLAYALKSYSVCVVSGGALGVDIAAHEAAYPYTIAVYANGLNILYPRTNSKILSQINQNALAISEYEPDKTPLQHQFLERNRIVVALSKALVIAQADINSGSMQSARIAHEIGVPIYVLPQRYNESNGTNKLLKDGKATLIDDIDEFAMKFKSNYILKLKEKDEILEFCKYGVSLNDALNKFGQIIYEYELDNKLIINNLIVKTKG